MPGGSTDIKGGTDIPVCAAVPKVEQTFLSAQSPIADTQKDQTRMSGPLSDTKVEQTFLSAQSPIPPSRPFSPQVVDRKHRTLPHWTQACAIYWITFRLADALPQEKLREWQRERNAWTLCNPEPWSDAQWTEYDERFGERLEHWLDAGYGSRALARSNIRESVREVIQRFDGERHLLHACVIMPTHVHLLLEPLNNQALSLLLKGIKGTSARAANKLLGTSATFWLDESYDHIVRSEKQYNRFLRYIEENPTKASLSPNDYWLHLPQVGTNIPACASPKGGTDIPVCAAVPKVEQTFLSAQSGKDQTGMSGPPCLRKST